MDFAAKCINAALTMNGYGIRILGANSQLTSICLASPLLFTIYRNVMPPNGNMLLLSLYINIPTISQKLATT